MAYMQHDCFEVSGTFLTTSGQCSAPALTLTALERQVVALAAREPLSSLATGKRLIASGLFGVQPARALADPRLEALRRFVVLHRHGRRDAVDAGELLVRAGFSSRALEDVRAHVTIRNSTWTPAVLGLVAMTLLLVVASAFVATYLDDLLPAIAIALTLCAPRIVFFYGLAVPGQRANYRAVA